MGNFTRVHKIVILIIAIIITFSLGYKILVDNDSKGIEIEENGLFSENDEIDEFSDGDNQEDQKIDSEEATKEVVIHITGEVAKPGVVTLENGDRVIDAIKKAGGLTPSADENRINLAQKLFDEDKVIIPKIGENLEMDSSLSESTESTQSFSQDIIMSKNNNGQSGDSNSGGQVNINTASKEELKSLPGIGDVTSQKIIDYRESTKFNSIEDIKKVSGIGEKKFEAIKPMITAR